MKKLSTLLVLLLVSQWVRAFCFAEAAERYGVQEWLLVAIAKTESGFDPHAVNRSNANGTEDFGLMQINSSWLRKLAKYNIDRDRLMDPCVNVNVGAWVLAENFAQYGAVWKAVGAYNARSPDKQIAYVEKVRRNIDPAMAVYRSGRLGLVPRPAVRTVGN